MIDALPTRNAYLLIYELCRHWQFRYLRRISMVDLESIQLFSITVAFNQCTIERFSKKTETYVCLDL